MSDDIHCSEIAPRFLLVPINSFKKKIMCSQTKKPLDSNKNFHYLKCLAFFIDCFYLDCKSFFDANL